ncbi:TfuA-like protein [Nonomuraea candida]|uniref:TfuA-like protein n=1 Tax=Nonomuraea candida TaxID=359159 RepID=UPI0006943F91|nr:TfuA-like protein [Nonomuraea candida]
MNRRFLFVGPTLPDAARLIEDETITVLPPVAAGDLLRLPLSPGDAVGIVDGYFHQVGAVRHKEILTLLNRGIRVLGAASMGALRAAELDTFGMEGVGGIYADYRDGRLEADDEVTLVHCAADEEYRPLSEPLVCIRATLARAVEEGVCDTEAARRLIEVFARWPYHRRGYDGLSAAGRQAGLDMGTVGRIRRYCMAHPADPKRDDALMLLDALRDGRPAPPHAGGGVPEVNRTSFLHAWQMAAWGRGISADEREADLAALHVCQLFMDDYPRFHRDLVFGALAAECQEECGATIGCTLTDREEIALRHGEHRGLYRLPPDRDRLGFLTHWLTDQERNVLSSSDQLIVFLARGFRLAPGIAPDEFALRSLRGQPVWARARHVVRLAWELNDRIVGVDESRDPIRLPRRKVLEVLAEWYGADQHELDFVAMDRGLESAADLADAGRAFYMLAKYNRGAITRLLSGAGDPELRPATVHGPRCDGAPRRNSAM